MIYLRDSLLAPILGALLLLAVLAAIVLISKFFKTTPLRVATVLLCLFAGIFVLFLSSS